MKIYEMKIERKKTKCTQGTSKRKRKRKKEG